MFARIIVDHIVVTCRRPAPPVGVAKSFGILLVALFALGTFAPCYAQTTLAYSFEADLEGFGPNGGGVTVTQDTVGATEGTQSMKVEVVQGATFVGALTSTLTPEIGDPPGMDLVVFDLTITEAFPSNPGDFVDAGITIFGASQPDSPGGQQFGLQAQFLANQAPLGALEVGTHEIQMPLLQATHPLTFVDGSFNDIFGVEGSGEFDLIPTGLQIYINKSSTAPWTGYIDNIRVGLAPPPEDADFNDDTFVDGVDLELWMEAFGLNDGGDANGDSISDGADFLIWQRQFGIVPAIAAVPEPSSVALASLALLAACCAPRLRRTGE